MPHFEFLSKKHQKTHQNQDPVGDLCELNDQSFEVPLEKPAAQYLAGAPMAWCPF